MDEDDDDDDDDEEEEDDDDVVVVVVVSVRLFLVLGCVEILGDTCQWIHIWPIVACNSP